MRRSDPPSVLLVEDADDEREMYAASLQLRGYGILETRNGDDAIRLATQLRPFVIVTDVVLQGTIDGFTLTRSLKDDPRTRDTPVIVLTGRVFEKDRDTAARAGCDLLLRKPCSPDALVRSIRRCEAIRRLAHIRGRAVPATLLARDVPPARRKQGS